MKGFSLEISFDFLLSSCVWIFSLMEETSAILFFRIPLAALLSSLPKCVLVFVLVNYGGRSSLIPVE